MTPESPAQREEAVSAIAADLARCLLEIPSPREFHRDTYEMNLRPAVRRILGPVWDETLRWKRLAAGYEADLAAIATKCRNGGDVSKDLAKWLPIEGGLAGRDVDQSWVPGFNEEQRRSA